MHDFASTLSLISIAVQIVFVLALNRLLRMKYQLQADESLLIALVIGIFGTNLLHLCFLALGMGGVIFNLAFIAFVLSYWLIQRRNSFSLNNSRGSNYGHFFGVALIGFMSAIQILVNTFKQESSIDGLLYHGPTLGNLVSGKSIWNFDAINQYEYYTDLAMVGAINFVGLTEVARFDDAVQVPYMIVFAAAVSTLLSNKVKNSALRYSLAALILASPVVWLQPRIQYVDLAYASSILAAVALFFASKSRSNLVYFAIGTAVAAVIAIKPTGLIIGIVFALVSLIYILRTEEPHKSKFLYGAVLLLPVLTGTLFYFRNILEFGNPLYPVAVKAGPLQLPGPIDIAAFTSRGGTESGLFDLSRFVSFVSSVVDGAVNGVTKLDYDPRSGGFSYISWTVPVLAILAFSALLLNKRRNERVTQSLQLSLCLLVSAILILGFQPGASDSRYVIAPYALIFCAAILAMPVIPIQNFVTATVILATGVSIYWNENNLYMGIKSVTPQLASNVVSLWPGGAPPTLDPGPGFDWLPNNECVQISIQSEGGVKGGGMAELTYQNTLSYGYFGNQLCNDLEILVLPLAETQNLSLNDDMIRTIGNSEFLVAYVDSSLWFESQLNSSGISLEEVKVIEGQGDYPQRSILFRVIS
jgi:hypothetical protein